MHWGQSYFLPILLVALSWPVTAAACRKDTDCKGDRVCENGQCMSPTASNQSPPSAKRGPPPSKAGPGGRNAPAPQPNRGGEARVIPASSPVQIRIEHLIGSESARRQVGARIMALEYELHRCGHTIVARNPNALPLHKKVAIRFVVHKSGQVKSQRTTGVAPDLDACLRATFDAIAGLPTFDRDHTMLQVLSYWNKLGQKTVQAPQQPREPAKPEKGTLDQIGHLLMTGVRAHKRQQESERQQSAAAEFRHRVASYPSRCIFAAAPKNVTIADLGRPLDSSFDFIRGADGQSLVPESRRLTKPMSGFDSVRREIEDVFEFKANAKAWEIVSGRLAKRRHTSAVLRRSIYVTQIVMVDDKVPVHHANTPSRARYYLAGLQLGHMYDAAVWSDKRAITASVAAKFLALKGSGEEFAARSELEFKMHTRGLKSSQQAVLAGSVHAIEEAFRSESGFARPEPVIARYCTIDGRWVEAVHGPRPSPQFGR